MSHQSGRQNSGNHPTGKEKRLQKNDSLRDLWENIKPTNVHIIGAPEGEERQKGTENLFEGTTAEDFFKLGKETHPSPGITETQMKRTKRPT